MELTLFIHPIYHCPRNIYFSLTNSPHKLIAIDFELTLSSFRREGNGQPDLADFRLCIFGHWKKHSSNRQRGTLSDSRSGTSSSGATVGRSGAEKISRLLFIRPCSSERI